MASSDKKRKSKQEYKPGKGGARASRARQASVRTSMKIKRFKRYQAEVEAGTRAAPVFKHGKHTGEVNTNRWSTAGLDSHLSNLQGIVKLGKTG